MNPTEDVDVSLTSSYLCVGQIVLSCVERGSKYSIIDAITTVCVDSEGQIDCCSVSSCKCQVVINLLGHLKKVCGKGIKNGEGSLDVWMCCQGKTLLKFVNEKETTIRSET